MKRSRSLLKTLCFRTAAGLGFLTTLFSMNFICVNSDGPCMALATLQRVGEIIRRPAMMRVNSVVQRPAIQTVLEQADLNDEDSIDLSDESDRPRHFGLATRNDFSKGADGRRVSAVRELARDYSMILPANLAPVSDVAGISMQIVDHSINAFFNRPDIKDSFVGRAANTVEKKLKAEVELGGSEPESIKHNVKFQVKATETKASMEYRGLTNCDLSYSVAARMANIEIFEPLSQSSNLVFTHSDTPSERRDVLSLRMNW